MTREEVEKLTDKELRVKAAELTGWTEIRVLSGVVVGTPPGGGVRTTVSDYPHSIAAAWELVDVAADRGLWVRVHGPFFKGKPYWGGFTPHNTTGWNGHMDYEAQGSSASLALTRAFVLAMTQEAA